MSFQNTQVALSELPAADHLDFEPMADAYPREVVVQSIISWIVLLGLSVVPVFVVPDTVDLAVPFQWLPLLILVLAIFATWLAWRAARVKGMALREHDIAYRTGLIWRKTILLAFCRIQHIEISSGPLQRKFGLASLKFFTAGGLNVDMRIDGLLREDAEQIRSDILSRVVREH